MVSIKKGKTGRKTAPPHVTDLILNIFKIRRYDLGFRSHVTLFQIKPNGNIMT